jgi:hypothetical protein
MSRHIARERPEALRWSGRAMALRGKGDRALDLYGRALDEAEKLGAAPEIARVCADISFTVGRGGDQARYRELSAAQWLARAIKGFVSLGLVKDAEAVGYVPATSALDAGSATAKARPLSGVNGK